MEVLVTPYLLYFTCLLFPGAIPHAGRPWLLFSHLSHWNRLLCLLSLLWLWSCVIPGCPQSILPLLVPDSLATTLCLAARLLALLFRPKVTHFLVLQVLGLNLAGSIQQHQCHSLYTGLLKILLCDKVSGQKYSVGKFFPTVHHSQIVSNAIPIWNHWAHLQCLRSCCSSYPVSSQTAC